MSYRQWLHAALGLAALSFASNSHAITINVSYDDTRAGAVMPGFDPTGAQLMAIANYAASYYEDIFEDNHTINLTFWYSDLPDNQLGNHDHIANDGLRETDGTIRIDWQDSMGVARNYWYDPSPQDDNEFTMQQTLWRDLTTGPGGQQGDWYVWSGTVPDTFEAGYRSTGGTPTGGIDMVTLVLHEVGHALGMSGGTPGTVTETMDGDYDFDSDWVFGASLAADTVDQATDFVGHLDNSLALMFPSGITRRERPSHTDLFAMAAGHQYSMLDVPRREFYAPNGSWGTDGNWSGDNTPSNANEVFVRSGRTATLNAFAAAGDLNITEGAHVNTQSNTLFVQNTTELGDGGGAVSRITIGAGGQLDSDILNIRNDGRVTLSAQTSLLESERVLIESGGELRGRGTVNLNDPLFGELISEGTIEVTGGSLTITSMNALALDFASGDVLVQSGDLILNTGFSDSIGATVTVGAGRTIFFNFGGSIGAGGLLQLNGTANGPATSDGTNLFVGLNGGINASGVGVIENTLIMQPSSFLTTEFGDPNSEVYINGTTLFGGGTINGLGLAQQNGDVFVTGNIRIAIDTYDMDGAAGNTEITIETGAVMAIESAHTDTTGDNFNGTINIDGGTLDMTPNWELVGTLNMTEVGDTPVLTGPGTLTINSAGLLNVAGSAIVESDTIINGHVFVGSDVDFDGTTVVNSTATLETDGPGDEIDFDGPVTLNGGSYVGNGLLSFDNTVHVVANTAIGMADTDLDGDTGNAVIQIDPGVTFSVASGSLEATPGDGFDGVMNVEGTFSSIVGFLLDGEVNMTRVGGFAAPVIVGIAPMEIRTPGLLTTDGNAVINRELIVNGSMEIGAGVTQVTSASTFNATADVSIATGGTLELNGPITFSGGTYTGSGMMRLNDTTTVVANTTIDVARVDLDGAGETTTIDVNNAAFTLNVDRIDANNSIFNSTINVVGENASLNINLSNPGFAWRLGANGELNFINPGATTEVMLTGSDLDADGTLNVTGRVALETNIGVRTRLNAITATSRAHFAGDARSYVYANPGATIAGLGSTNIDNGTTVNLEDQTLVATDTFNSGRLEIGFAASEVAIDTTVAGMATIRGTFGQTGNGEFAVDLGGLVQSAEYDLLNVIGTARIAGTIEVTLIDDFVPTVGNTFEVLTATNLIGMFDTIETIDQNDVLAVSMTASYPSNNVVLEVTDVFLIGDYNDDGAVDAADYTVWRDNVGAAPGTLPNDILNVVVGPQQYAVWRANFGNVMPSPGALAGSTVPEPSTVILAGLAFAAACCGRRLPLGR